MKFSIVDAFADRRFTGNPAAVFIVNDFPGDDLMQNIATEINLSETAFVKKITDHNYQIRWFTPNSEAPLCGHATIAAMHVLVSNDIENKDDWIVFQSISGELAAIYQDSYITLNFPRYIAKSVDFDSKLQGVVGITPVYSGFSENCFFMEFPNSRDVVNLEPDLGLLKKLNCRALIITAKGDGDFANYDFVSRYFAPKVGIDEDPVCASAHCRLIPYWATKLNKDKMIAFQPSKRGGIIKCQDLQNRVLISGQAVTVMKCELC